MSPDSDKLLEARKAQARKDYAAQHFCSCVHPIPDRVMMGERECRACGRFIAGRSR